MSENKKPLPVIDQLTKAELEKAVHRFEKMTKDRPIFNGVLTFFLLMPLVNLIVRLAADLPTDPWHYAEAFLFLLPIAAIWAGFFISRSLRKDFQILIEQNLALLARLEDQKTVSQPH